MIYSDGKDVSKIASKLFTVLRGNLISFSKNMVTASNFDKVMRPILEKTLLKNAQNSAASHYPKDFDLRQSLFVTRGTSGIALKNRTDTSFAHAGGKRIYSTNTSGGAVAASIAVKGKPAAYALYLNSGGTMRPSHGSKYLARIIDKRERENFESVREYLDSVGSKNTFTGLSRKKNLLIYKRHLTRVLTKKSSHLVQTPIPLVYLFKSVTFKATHWADKALKETLEPLKTNVDKYLRELFLSGFGKS